MTSRVFSRRARLYGTLESAVDPLDFVPLSAWPVTEDRGDDGGEGE